MTSEQKAWIDAKRTEGYEPVGVLGGNTRYVGRGFLLPDGTVIPKTRGAFVGQHPGAIEVGKLVAYEAGRPLDTRPARPRT